MPRRQLPPCDAERLAMRLSSPRLARIHVEVTRAVAGHRRRARGARTQLRVCDGPARCQPCRNGPGREPAPAPLEAGRQHQKKKKPLRIAPRLAPPARPPVPPGFRRAKATPRRDVLVRIAAARSLVVRLRRRSCTAHRGIPSARSPRAHCVASAPQRSSRAAKKRRLRAAHHEIAVRSPRVRRSAPPLLLPHQEAPGSQTAAISCRDPPSCETRRVRLYGLQYTWAVELPHPSFADAARGLERPPASPLRPDQLFRQRLRGHILAWPARHRAMRRYQADRQRLAPPSRGEDPRRLRRRSAALARG